MKMIVALALMALAGSGLGQTPTQSAAPLSTLTPNQTSATAPASTPGEDHNTISAFFGKSFIVFGSSEVRWGGGISYSYSKHEPRFDSRIGAGHLVVEGYYDNTVGNGQRAPAWDSDAVGFLYYGRWYARSPVTKPRPFFDLGWGFQYADRPTHDLPSEINSTPMGDLGVSFPYGKDALSLSVRWLHISNAGFVSPNRGQNQLYLMLGYSY
jgi:hypothetical protein